MERKIELLAPAGDADSLRAAVENGADAVYLGGKLFNARQLAGNFEGPELERSLDYAHIRGANIYLAMNTLILDSEMDEAVDFACSARLMGVDGIIVQDIGLAGELRRVMPDVPLHASTQMTIYDIEGVRALEAMGFKRVVPARELSLEEIGAIAGATALEVEMFIHGALCICYSGQCLMSSIIGGRSGNRGKCAQPCRLPYRLAGGGIEDGKPAARPGGRTAGGAGRREAGGTDGWTAGEARGRAAGGTDGWMAGEARGHLAGGVGLPAVVKAAGGSYSGYLMSPKDLSSVKLLDKIVSSGVRSLKIEGRMKSPEYVATVVRIYRKYLDIAMSLDYNGGMPGQDVPGRGEPGRGIPDQDEPGRSKPNQGKPIQGESDFSKLVDEKDMNELAQIFNRGGFSQGYLCGRTGADMMCYEKPKNWGVYIGKAISYDRSNASVTARLAGELSIGDGVEVLNGEEENPGTVVSSLKKGGTEVRSAGSGEVVTIGGIRGRVPPNSPIYKTSDRKLLAEARETFSGKPHRQVAIEGHAELREGRPLALRVYDRDGNEASASGDVMPEKALNRPLDEDRLTEQLKRTGSTPFRLDRLETTLDSGLALPVSEINEVRRRALAELERKRAAKYPGRGEDDCESRRARGFEGRGIVPGRTCAGQDIVPDKAIAGQGIVPDRVFVGQDITPDRIFADQGIMRDRTFAGQGVMPDRTLAQQGIVQDRTFAGQGRISLYFYKWDGSLDYSRFKADRLYLPLEAIFDKRHARVFKECRDNGSEVYISLPTVTRGNYDRLIRSALMGREAAISLADGVLAGNLGTVKLLKSMPGIKLAGDQSLNVFNGPSAWEACSMGLDSAMLSLELTLGQACRIGQSLAAGWGDGRLALEAAVYGRLPLMTSEYCPVGSVTGGLRTGSKCGGSCRRGEFRLIDRKNIEFPLVCDDIDCRSTVLNSNVLFAPDVVSKLKQSGIGMFRLYIWDEKPGMVSDLIACFRRLSGGNGGGGDKGSTGNYDGSIRDESSMGNYEGSIGDEGSIRKHGDNDDFGRNGDYDMLVERIKSRGYTKGHYFRGV